LIEICFSHEKAQKTSAFAKATADRLRHEGKLTTNPFDLVRLSSPQVAQDKSTRMDTNFLDADCVKIFAVEKG
jgi:hypothetical protein